ncbi:cobyrinate a,c-diamide synthase [Aquimarina sp. W85]|uniref:cobyrinate a,c-diamide synthase n=1 Tax=Aquimarina rhodophyticola TaxID=3342246 RepID=UPI003671A55B
MTKQFIISAPSSNAGKTTLTLGLLRLFKRNAMNVQPFKVGPDYIDPKFHKLACGNVGVNLDMFMMTSSEIQNNLDNYGKEARVRCIEGVMGLFDGSHKDKGSTADLAKNLKTPVLMVIDAKAVAYSVAPLIQGFNSFDKDVQIMGVIFNRVGSERHFHMLKEACNDIAVPCFGYLSNLNAIEIPSRHLGLNIDEIEKFDIVIDRIADQLEKTVDWKAIIAASKEVKPSQRTSVKKASRQPIKFAVARDEAFNFIYPQHVKAMRDLGEVQFFSPIHDLKIPTSDFLYLPGGYPESYLEELSRNKHMLCSIKEFAHNNGRIYAECGGMMYLGKAIVSEKQKAYPMVSFFDFEATIAFKKLHLGYRVSEMNTHTFYGHEFHYSSLINLKEAALDIHIKDARANNTTTKIYKKQRVIGSYVHHYFGTSELLLKLINELNNNT